MEVSAPVPSNPSKSGGDDKSEMPRDIQPNEVTSKLPMYLELTREHIIRLVEILPGPPTTPIKIRLSIHELEHAPIYDAISYVWGTGKERVKIHCNSVEFMITATLDACLRRLRRGDSSRMVWADAICINQESVKERNHHVAFMNLVYTNARNVLICMGEAEDADAVNVKDLVAEHVVRSTGYEKVKDMPELARDDPLLRDPRWLSVAKLFRNKWFTRAWVLQEAGVARNPIILWGSQEIDYRATMSLARWIVNCASSLQYDADVFLLTVHSDWWDWSRDWEDSQDHVYGLIDLLSAAKGLHCSIKHDHVYALLGHPLMRVFDGKTGEDLGGMVEPEYEAPFEDVLLRFTTGALPKTGIKFLSAVEHDNETIQADLPSWVVRWNMDIIWNSFGYYKDFHFRASGPEGEKFAPDPPTIEGNKLIEDAVFVDTISLVHEFSDQGAAFELANALTVLSRQNILSSALDEIWRSINNIEIPCIYTDAIQALSLTLCTGLINYKRAEDDLPRHQADFAGFRKVWAAVSEGITETLTKEDHQSANHFYRDVNLSCKGRSFFITRLGYYGLGPLISRPGDECHIFRCARVPYVLRPTDDGAYRLVGETYLHGVMEGEYVGREDVSWSRIEIV